jgi:hypothetical protein
VGISIQILELIKGLLYGDTLQEFLNVLEVGGIYGNVIFVMHNIEAPTPELNYICLALGVKGLTCVRAQDQIKRGCQLNK